MHHDIIREKEKASSYNTFYLLTLVPCHTVIFTCQATPQKVHYETEFDNKPFSRQYVLNVLTTYTIEQSTMETNHGKRQN